MTRSLTLMSFLLLAGPAAVRGQGCSDAGACSAGAIGQLRLWQDSTVDVVDYRSMARIGYTYAIGEQGTTIMQANAEVSIGIGPRLSVQVKLPYIWAQGDLGQNQGIGDAILTTSYAIIKKKRGDLAAVLGVRLPKGSVNAGVPMYQPNELHPLYLFDKPLPMPYQTGLGTTDLLVGVNARLHRWQAALAYQHVMSRNSSNQFHHGIWFHDEHAEQYFGSRFLERADDVVARLQYAYGCGRLSLQPGLLAIFHIAEDTRLSEGGTESDPFPQREAVTGSKGLTLNATLDLRFKLSEQWAIETSAGIPVVTREARPDGLTREFVGSVWLRFRF